MSRPPKVYVDFDDVLCRTASALSSLLLEHFGKHVPTDKIFSFDLDESFDLTEGELETLMTLMHEPECLLAVEPEPGAMHVLKEWRARGIRIEIVTGRPPHSFEASRAWLAQEGVPYDALIFVDKYNRIDRAAALIPVLTLDELSTHRYELSVEDAPRMIARLLGGMSRHVVVMDRPWNRSLQAESAPEIQLHRCVDWQAIGKLAARSVLA